MTATSHGGDRPAVSAVVPCFNEAKNLFLLYRRLAKVLKQETGNHYEIVLVDDGSKDETWPHMLEIAKRDVNVVAVRLSRNHGHQLALSAGLKLCTGDRILIIDADLQDPPELLADMMALMDNGAQIVYGQRRRRAGETWFKRKSAALYYFLLERLADIAIPRDTGDFRLMSRRALDLLLAMPEQQRFIRGMVAWVGLDQRPLLYDRHPRHAGETKYTLVKMIGFAISGITSFSVTPLRIAAALGVFVSILAVLSLGHTIFSWLFLDTVSGWTSVMTGMLVLSGVQLLVLGIIGEYLGRVYVEVKKRPLFLIDTIVRNGDASAVQTAEIQHHAAEAVA